jgi:hypothetical protein
VRLACFTATVDPADIFVELARHHHVDRLDRSNAHDFVWRHFRAPYDLTVFAVADTAAHQFIWPYMFHYPGLLVLHAASLHRSRAAMLVRERRAADLRRERAFSGWTMLRAPLAAARLVVVHDEEVARELREEHPDVEVRVVPLGVQGMPTAPRAPTARVHGVLNVAVTAGDRQVVTRAVERARAAGANVGLVGDEHLADVVVALEWPPTGAPPLAALRAMAAGTPVVVFETLATAAWPALDPQTWQSRSYGPAETPIAITIDPRDEEHSVMLSLRRLAADAALRASLGDAARTWTGTYANPRATAAAWEAVLGEAVQRAPRPHPANWPAHLTADGSARARAILGDIGAHVDFLEP